MDPKLKKETSPQISSLQLPTALPQPPKAHRFPSGTGKWSSSSCRTSAATSRARRQQLPSANSLPAWKSCKEATKPYETKQQVRPPLEEKQGYRKQKMKGLLSYRFLLCRIHSSATLFIVVKAMSKPFPHAKIRSILYCRNIMHTKSFQPSSSRFGSSNMADPKQSCLAVRLVPQKVAETVSHVKAIMVKPFQVNNKSYHMGMVRKIIH